MYCLVTGVATKRRSNVNIGRSFDTPIPLVKFLDALLRDLGKIFA